jgi:hypothetical protein
VGTVKGSSTIRRKCLIGVLIAGLLLLTAPIRADGPFLHHVTLKRKQYVTYQTHYPDDTFLSYEGDVDIPFSCFDVYHRTVQLVVEIVKPGVVGFRRVDVVLYMGIDSKLVGMDRSISQVKSFIVNTPDVRPMRPFEKPFQAPENLNVRIKMYPEIDERILRNMEQKDVINDERLDRIPCIFKVWWRCG